LGHESVVERTSSWQAKLAHKNKLLVRCTERVGRVIDFWVAFCEVVISVRRLAGEGWTRYRWEGGAIPTTMTPIDGSSKSIRSSYSPNLVEVEFSELYIQDTAK
jgi:hypothetical protein